MYRLVLISLIIFGLVLTSCGSKDKSGNSDGNIDVDSDIYIVPIGDVDVKYLKAIVPKLEERFTTNVHVAEDKKNANP